MANIILLGAGASFGSGDVSPYPPPLGGMLFEKLESLGKTAARLPEETKKIFRDNFERGMKEYLISSNNNVMSFQRELGGYLARFSPGQNNCYIKLLRSLNLRRFIFVSLNYDLLLEIAAFRVGLNTKYSNEYENGFLRILKIHGSSNFWHDTTSLVMKNVVIRGSVYDYNLPISPLSQPESIWRSISEDSAAPAMSVFAEGKAVRVSPEYVHRQQQMWFDSLSSCSKIFIVGVRVHQVDEHIWTRISKSKAHVHDYGFPSDKDEFIEWKSNFGRKNATFHLLDFAKAIPHISRIAT